MGVPIRAFRHSPGFQRLIRSQGLSRSAHSITVDGPDGWRKHLIFGGVGGVSPFLSYWVETAKPLAPTAAGGHSVPMREARLRIKSTLREGRS